MSASPITTPEPTTSKAGVPDPGAKEGCQELGHVEALRTSPRAGVATNAARHARGSQQELPLRIALGTLIATKGYAAPEVVEQTYARARRSVSTWTTPTSFSQCCVACGVILTCVPSIRRPSPWASSS